MKRREIEDLINLNISAGEITEKVNELLTYDDAEETTELTEASGRKLLDWIIDQLPSDDE